LAGIFSSLPAIFFGPVFGGASSGIIDILGFLLKPTGPYMPEMTAAAIAGGVLKDNKDYSAIFTIAEGLRVAKSLERSL
jgi:hypothetical protein